MSLDQLVEELSKLSVLDMAKLKTLLEDKWGVKASAGVAMMAAAPAAGGGAPAAQESTEFKVSLASFDESKKIGVIKVVREITGLGLKEAKDLVEGVTSRVLKESCAKAEADQIAEKISAGGGKVEVVGL